VKKGDNNQLKQAPWWPLIVALLVVTAAWMISWFVIQSQYTTGTDRGTFGDMFGAVNALFSGFAFAGLGYAIYLQRQELADTRKSLLDQKQDAKIQNDSLVRQSFENVFFQLLRQHSELIGTLSVKQKGQLEIGRRCFEEWFLDLVRRYQIKSDNTLGSIEIVKQVLQEIDPALEQSTGHYFRSLCGILRFADQSGLPSKETYIQLVRNQLSTFEVSILFYRCAISDDYADLKMLVERYALLRHINASCFITRIEHKELFAPAAYLDK
jgi:Putative phage abortive infection protein